MTRYCLICEREWGPGVNTCCAEGSLVATKVEGVFKKRKRYFTLDGTPLAPEQLNEMTRVARAKFKTETPATPAAPTPKSAPPDATLKIQKQIQDNLELLKFLCNCGKFDLDKLRAFTALSAQLGKPFDGNTVRQMESANQMIGGYEQLRMEVMIPGQMKAYMTFVKLLADMRPSAATAQFLVDAQRQFDAIGAQFKKDSASKAESPSTEQRKESGELTVSDWALLERNFGLTFHNKHGDGPVQWQFEGRLIDTFVKELSTPEMVVTVLKGVASNAHADLLCLGGGTPLSIMINTKPPGCFTTSLSGASAIADVVVAFTRTGARTVVDKRSGLVVVQLSEA